MLEMSESRDTCKGKLITRNRNSTREIWVLQSTKLNRVGDMKNILMSDIEMNMLEF